MNNSNEEIWVIGREGEHVEIAEWWICSKGPPFSDMERNGCGMRFILPPDDVMPAAQCAIEYCPHCGQEYSLEEE